ncbi:MAG: riboflavin synthase [Phycisphaerales bacterium]
MFTGLIQAIGRVRAIRPLPAGVRLEIDPGPWTHRPEPGDSIAVAGCCLTLVATSPTSPAAAWSFDVVPESLARTRLSALKPGDRVNLEHAVTPSTLMGGHFVQGHVDAVGTVVSIVTAPEWRVAVAVPPALAPYLVPKGSICIDGVSLTIAAIPPAARPTFEVALIPTTLERTTLGALKPGDPVNIEADMIAKTVVRYLDLAHARPSTAT